MTQNRPFGNTFELFLRLPIAEKYRHVFLNWISKSSYSEESVDGNMPSDLISISQISSANSSLCSVPLFGIRVRNEEFSFINKVAVAKISSNRESSKKISVPSKRSHVKSFDSSAFRSPHL